jgi:hypothetical protein
VSRGLPECRDLLVLAANAVNREVREFKVRLALRV